jgi:molybdate transport system substrate-binding protein
VNAISTVRRARIAALLALTACGAGGAAEPRAVRVFAAASLAAPFAEIGAAFARVQPGRRVELHTAGTPQLVLQLREGAAADVFASADPGHMQAVQALGLLAAPAVEFARNRLAIAVAAGNPRGIRGLADLARAELRVAMCGPEVPAGRYARQALAKAGVAVASRSDEPSVKALVAKVQLGELDAGIVYTTDTRAQGVEGVVVAAEHDVVASCPIAVLTRATDADAARAFVALVVGAEGRAILAGHGFVLP